MTTRVVSAGSSGRDGDNRISSDVGKAENQSISYKVVVVEEARYKTGLWLLAPLSLLYPSGKERQKQYLALPNSLHVISSSCVIFYESTEY